MELSPVAPFFLVQFVGLPSARRRSCGQTHLSLDPSCPTLGCSKSANGAADVCFFSQERHSF